MAVEGFGHGGDGEGAIEMVFILQRVGLVHASLRFGDDMFGAGAQRCGQGFGAQRVGGSRCAHAQAQVAFDGALHARLRQPAQHRVSGRHLAADGMHIGGGTTDVHKHRGAHGRRTVGEEGGGIEHGARRGREAARGPCAQVVNATGVHDALEKHVADGGLCRFDFQFIDGGEHVVRDHDLESRRSQDGLAGRACRLVAGQHDSG